MADCRISPGNGGIDTDPASGLFQLRRLWHADEQLCLAAADRGSPSSPRQSASASRAGRANWSPRCSGEASAASRPSIDPSGNWRSIRRLGLALLSLAEALLRVPDAANGRSTCSAISSAASIGALRNSAAIIASTLRVSSALTVRCAENTGAAKLRHLSAPLVRWGARSAMRIIGGEFVFAQSIEEALARARSPARGGDRYSFDMLGEAALTVADAQRYFNAYEHAIHAVGAAYRGLGPIAGGSVSVKLSALHPRYHYAQRERVLTELLPRLSAARAARHSAIESHWPSMPRKPNGSTSRSI